MREREGDKNRVTKKSHSSVSFYTRSGNWETEKEWKEQAASTLPDSNRQYALSIIAPAAHRNVHQGSFFFFFSRSYKAGRE